jgi:hypothetical protein
MGGGIGQGGTCFKRCTTSDECRSPDYGCGLRGGATRTNVCAPLGGEDAGI